MEMEVDEFHMFCGEDLHTFSDTLDLKNEEKEEIMDNFNG